MHKKLIVVAVAGALAAPVTALAQTTIYGLFNAEWSPSADQPNLANGQSRASAEGFNSGASRIGFRGEEKMGGGLSAWYQCESELAIFPRGNEAQGTNIDPTDALWCTRNSALGLRGSWGNFFVGSWDSPLKRMSAVTRITNETGWMGSQGLTLRQGPGSPNMSQRNTDSFNYDTPNLGGFSGSFQVTTTQATVNAAEATPPNTDGRIISLGGQYATGRLAVVAGYTKNEDNRAAGGTGATPSPNAEDTAVLLGVKYGFGPVELGFTWTERESNPAVDTKTKRAGWNLAGTWTIAGPHSLIFGYAVADDLKNEGNAVAAQSGSETGATQMQIGYKYGFSKRTVGTIGYVKLDNDNNGVYNLTDLISGSANVQTGQSASAFVLSLTHSF